jgi:hypothetical protein
MTTIACNVLVPNTVAHAATNDCMIHVASEQQSEVLHSLQSALLVAPGPLVVSPAGQLWQASWLLPALKVPAAH